MRRVAQHPTHLLRIAAGRATGGSSRAEQWSDTMCAPMAFGFEALAAQGHRESRSNIVAERYRPQEVGTADAEALPGRKRRRNHGAPRMGLRWRMRIVGFVGVCEHAVGQRRFDGSAQE